MRTKAVHIVQHHHLRTASPTFEKLMEYVSVAVCNMGLDVEEARSRAPHATYLVSFDCLTAPHYGSGAALRETLRPWFLLDDSGKPVVDGSGNYFLQPVFDCYDAYAHWIASNLSHFDGGYADQCLASPLPPWVLVATRRDDDEGQARWPRLRDYFLTRISDLWRAPIVGNIGKGLGAPPAHLSGYSVESRHFVGRERIRQIGRLQNVRPGTRIVWRHENNDAALDPTALENMGVLDGLRI